MSGIQDAALLQTRMQQTAMQGTLTGFPQWHNHHSLRDILSRQQQRKSETAAELQLQLESIMTLCSAH